MYPLVKAGLSERDCYEWCKKNDITTNFYILGVPEEERLSDGNFIIDRTVSAQYLISAVEIIYNVNSWEYKLTLVKPTNKESLINKD